MTDQTTPKAVAEISDLYQAGIAHAFIVSGNINDYVAPGSTLSKYLAGWLAGRLLVTYDIARGFSFITRQAEKEFRTLIGEQQQAPQANPALAALQQARGQAPQAEPQATPLPSSPESALALIDRAFRAAEPQRMAVIIKWAQTVAPSSDPSTMAPGDRKAAVTLAGWATDSELEAKGHLIFLVCDSAQDLAPALLMGSSKWAQVVISYPDYTQRLDFIMWYAEARPEIGLDVSPSEFARMSAGLNLMMIEDIFLRGAMAGAVTSEFIAERKAQIIANEYGEVLEVMSTEADFSQVGGLEYIKEYFTRSVIRPMRQGNFSRVPMGVLMMGPAGTGKSIMAQAVAGEANINCVKLNIGGQIASKWQGEGERKLAKALAGILNFSPTLVFMDEIDQAISRGSGENQQDSRIFQMLLEFMAETSHRGQVVFLAATNRPDKMDAALRRPGRFDDKLAFLVPEAKERESIFQVMAKKFGLSLAQVPSLVVDQTQGYTGAEIEAITRKAATLAQDYDLTPEQALEQATSRIKATTQAIEFMTALALAEISDLDLLPPGYQTKAQDTQALEAQIEQGQRRQSRQL